MDSQERAAFVDAIGRSDDPAVIPLLRSFAGDPAVEVRLGVARHLPTLWGDDCDAASLAVMLELCGDKDAEVRDWAAFAFNQCPEIDRAEVRRALIVLLFDDDDESDAPFEAAVALAVRGDPAAVPRVREWLEVDDPDEIASLAIEAAGWTRDASLLPVLRRLTCHEWGPDFPHDKLVRWAIGVIEGRVDDPEGEVNRITHR